jgi:pantoate--beta-alanine ligase
MRLITSIADMKAFSRQVRTAGKSLALVPTMGALHDGHLSLVRQARSQCDVVILSIFANPTQFGPGDDFERYPRTLDQDMELARPFKVEGVFAPSVAEMYPEGFETFIEPGEIALPLEGTSRPGHFRGVATVILKLFSIVRPDVAYFGQKDFQQALIVRRLVKDLNLDVRLVICPLVRDPDGLAKSTRNAYLSAEDRVAALALSRGLQRAQELVHTGETDASKIVENIRKVIAAEPRVKLDYAVIVEPSRLLPVERVAAGSLALVAARVGETRLIDNLIFGPAGANSELLLRLALTASPDTDTRTRIPGLETETLRLRIESCRDCAAITSILLPPREFLSKYVKRDYPDLNTVRVAVIGRDAPIRAENFLYYDPNMANRFVSALYELLGVQDFVEFRRRFVLTDAIRCHSSSSRVPEKAMENCSRHLRGELNLFPNLDSFVVLGEDAYWQFQRLILARTDREFKPLGAVLGEQGWAKEEVRIPLAGERVMRAFYCYHPTYGYKHSPSIAQMLG